MKLLPVAVAAAIVLAGLTSQAPPAGFTYQQIFGASAGLGEASAMAFAPDGRLFLLERASGRIRVVRDAVLQQNPWAVIPVSSGGSWAEQGLLGIAFDPAFLTNRYVYVYYTAVSGTENRIARLVDSGGAGTNLTVLTAPGAIATRTYHNGGTLVFGLDGKLYVGTGDAQDTLTPQNPASWNGKILRFDVPNLTIPASNPVPNSAVYSSGHRNQFGLAVHPVTGSLFQSENGNALMDELNRIVPGGNYGWPSVEGREVQPNPSFVDPLAWFQPTIAPTGCAFYTGHNWPAAWRNVLFFTDYNGGRVRAVTLDAQGGSILAQSVFDDLPGAAFAVANGPDGNLWVLSNDMGSYGGTRLGRYIHQNEPQPSVNLTAVSNRSVGGSMTMCFRGQNGDIVVGWISARRFGVPLTSAFGNQWVPIDAMLPMQTIAADARSYHAVALPNDLSFVGLELHVQAMAMTLSTSTLRLTNAARFVLRG